MGLVVLLVVLAAVLTYALALPSLGRYAPGCSWLDSFPTGEVSNHHAGCVVGTVITSGDGYLLQSGTPLRLVLPPRCDLSPGSTVGLKGVVRKLDGRLALEVSSCP